MSQSFRSAAIVITATLVTSAARSQAQGDACSLLSKQDAAAALGEAASGPKSIGPISDGAGSTVTSCEYTGSGMHAVQLNLTRLPASSVPMYKGICAQQGRDGLAGLGEVACWYNDKHEELHVIKGTAFISLELRRSGNPTEPIKATMKKVLDKLK
jgi:hypothetical protein